MESFSKCGMCNSSYASDDKTPLILSCGDTFCESCLKKIQCDGKITCVDCKKVTVLSSSSEGVDALPTNNGVKKLAIQLNRMHLIFSIPSFLFSLINYSFLFYSIRSFIALSLHRFSTPCNNGDPDSWFNIALFILFGPG